MLQRDEMPEEIVRAKLKEMDDLAHIDFRQRTQALTLPNFIRAEAIPCRVQAPADGEIESRRALEPSPRGYTGWRGG